ncbi:MAG TPA: glycosyl hydrolase [Lentisphaeria bacterium]|nr:MAG: hypothetical protein A2X47_09470 [Lentisphaerae bacterium GWF2_38_69]HBM17100.1 glycosyl hydrolase [Lentisphaeria bacterium]
MRIKISFFSVIVIFLAVSGCSKSPFCDKTAAENFSYSYSSEQTEQIREKIGQMIMPDFRNWGRNEDGNFIPFTRTNPQVESLIKHYKFGGICLFRENIVNPEQTIKLVMSLQGVSHIPLLLGIDQEGGVVTRLQSGTDMPGNMVLGATRDNRMVFDVAEAIGQELYCQGINLDFAPDIDVNMNPENPVIGVRSFGSNPQLVAQMGIAYIKGLRKANVLSCVKHFPGHGDTASDTHLGLAVVTHNIEELDELDLYPFEKTIEDGAMCVMVAHVIVPALDDIKVISRRAGRLIGVPATLSKVIVTGLLREKMRFKGLILTDAMDMKAISDNFGNSDASIRAILAGCDLVLMPARVWSEEDISDLEKLMSALEKEYKANEEFKARVNESYNRIISFKKKYELKKNTFASDNLNKEILNAEKILSSKVHKDLEEKASERGITLIKNDNNLLPIRMKNGIKILVLDANSIRLGIVKDEIENLASLNGINVNINTSRIDYAAHMTPRIEELIRNTDICLLLTYNLNSSSILPEEIAQTAKANSVKCVNIACRNPYDIAYVRSARAALCIYGAVGFDQTNSILAILKINLVSVIKTIFINNKTNNSFNEPVGKLPVDILSSDGRRILYAYGTGLSYNN